MLFNKQHDEILYNSLNIVHFSSTHHNRDVFVSTQQPFP